MHVHKIVAARCVNGETARADRLLEAAGVNAKHDLFKARLEQIGKQYGIFTEVRGMGLLIGCVLSDAFKGKAKDVFNAAEKENLMILQAGPDVVRFAPSLVVEDADINEGLDRFERAVKTLTQA